MNDIKIAVTLGGIFVLASTFPQVIQTVVTGLTRDINLYLIVFAIVGIAAYAYYAVRTRQWIFAIADSIDCIMWSIVLVIKVDNIMKGIDWI